MTTGRITKSSLERCEDILVDSVSGPSVPNMCGLHSGDQMSVNGEEQRVHVCSKFPCIKIHPSTKQNKIFLPPKHMRLVNLDGGGGGHEPAVAGTSSSSGDAAPPLPPPAASPAPPPTPPPTPPADESVSEEESDTPTSLGLDIEDDLTVPDKTAFAPAPSPAFLPGEGGQDVPPPGRATLLPIPSAVPCELRVPVEAAVPAISKKTAVVGQESSDDEPILLGAGLTNPAVAAELGKFLLNASG